MNIHQGHVLDATSSPSTRAICCCARWPYCSCGVIQKEKWYGKRDSKTNSYSPSFEFSPSMKDGDSSSSPWTTVKLSSFNIGNTYENVWDEHRILQEVTAKNVTEIVPYLWEYLSLIWNTWRALKLFLTASWLQNPDFWITSFGIYYWTRYGQLGKTFWLLTAITIPHVGVYLWGKTIHNYPLCNKGNKIKVQNNVQGE